MACEAVALCTTGAAATAYVFPMVSVTEVIVAVESFQLTITTLRFPAVCAPVKATVTGVCVAWGLTELVCTKRIGETLPTVKFTALLATPPTVTTTLPVVAPAGTGAVMLVALQAVGVAAVPLNVIVLVPCVAPKLAPAILTEVPTGLEAGARPVMLGGGGITAKLIPLLGWPPTVTTTLPVVVPLGTGTVMLVALHAVGVPAVPLKVTALVPWEAPKFAPAMATDVPTTPEVGLRLVMLGAGIVTVKLRPLLICPPTVTTTLPVVAPAGTGAAMFVAPQAVGVAAIPLNVTVLVPCVAPKLTPAIATDVPTGPETGLRLVMLGAVDVTEKEKPLLATPLTVTTTLPVVAPFGTGAAMLVALQLVGVAVRPLNVTVLVP